MERFGRVVLTAVQTNPDLPVSSGARCVNAAMRAAQDGLLPDGRLRAAFVVYKDKAARADRAMAADDCRHPAESAQLGRCDDLACIACTKKTSSISSCGR